MRIDRMLSIVVILLNRRRIKAKELSERFEVSLRTIYRDIEALNLAGIPIISNQGIDGGYEIPENYKLNRQFLSPSDMKSILSALKGMNTTLDDVQLGIIFEKIQSLLPESEKNGIDAGEEIIVFDTIGWDNSDRYAKKIQTIYDTIKTLKIIEITYRDGNGSGSGRKIEPMTLFQKGYAWYLFGYCLKRNDFRIFKLSRIKRIRVSEQTFVRKQAHYRSTFQQWQPPGKMVDAILKFSSDIRHVVEDYFESALVIDKDSRSITIKVTLPNGDWLTGMILSYGDSIEVLSPESLRGGIKKKIKKMTSLYET